MLNWFKKKNEIEKTSTEEDDFEEELKTRTSTEVAERILGLLAVIGKVHQGNDPKFINWYTGYQIEKYLSSKEKAFLNSSNPEHKSTVNFSWRAEALTSLLWSIKLIESMPPLNQQFDVYSVQGIRGIIENPKGLKSQIELRDDEELKEMEQNLYHQHWRVRDAQLFGKEMPSELDPGIVYERRYGLSWLIGWGDDWDEVPTDT